MTGSTENYSAPSLEILLEVFDAYDNEEVEEQEVLDAITEVEELIQVQLDQLEKMADAPSAQAIKQAFVDHLNALDLLEESLDDPEGPQFEDGIAAIQDSINRMVRLRNESVDTARQASAPVTCVFCGAENSRGQTRCGNCARPLPVASDQVSQILSTLSIKENLGLERTEKVTQDFLSLHEAITGFEKGEEDQESLEKIFEILAWKLQEHLNANEQIPEFLGECAPYLQQRGRDLAAKSENSILKSMEIIETMKLAFVKDDASYLSNGLHDFHQEAKILAECADELTELEKEIG